jgi:chromosome segregation ATPase
MKLEDRLGRVLQRQFDLIQELRRARDDVARARSVVQMRIASLEQQERDARKHYEDAVAEGDPQAESLRDWPDKARARIEELRAPVDDLAAAELRVTERIEAAEQDVEDFRLLQPQLAASVVAARNAGVGREVFDTLNDALNYIELALDTAAEEDPNGPLRAAPARNGGRTQGGSAQTAGSAGSGGQGGGDV